MNLGELYISISADTSSIEDVNKGLEEMMRFADSVSSGLKNVESAIESLETSMVSELVTGLSDASDSSDRATSSTKNLADQLEEAVAKGNLLSDAMEKAFSTVVDLAGKAGSAFVGFVSDSVQGYADYQQNVDAMQSTFGEYSGELLEWMQESSATYGISVNQLMEHANRSGVLMQKANAERRAAERAGEQQSTAEQKQELSNRVENLRSSLSTEESELRASNSKRLNDFKQNLQDEYDELKNALDAQVREQQSANERAIREKKDALDDSLEAAKRAMDDEVDAYNKATDERIRQINREYTERYKLIDEQKYNELKAIQDQIDALDRQQKADDRAAKERQYQKKMNDAKLKQQNSLSLEEIRKAQEEYNELDKKLGEEHEKWKRTDQKDSLKEQLSNVKDHYDKLKENLKQQQEDEISSYKASRKEGLDDLKDANADKLREMQRANRDELQDLKDSLKAQLQETKNRNSDILREKQRSNNELIREQQSAYNTELSNLKEHNRLMLQEERNRVAEQKKILSGSASEGVSVQIDSEDRRQSAETFRSIVQSAANVGTSRNMKTEDVLNILESINYGRYATFDNLGLGYANKTGIQNLINDMNAQLAASGKTADLDADDFNDIARALEMLVDNYKMTGRAAYEAENTISGSLNAAGAAWENFKVALATEDTEDDNLFLTQLFGDENNEGAIENLLDQLLPVIGRVLERIKEFAKEKLPGIIEQIKEYIPEDLFPPKVQQTLDAILDLIGKIADALVWVSDNTGLVVGAIDLVGSALGFVTLYEAVKKVKGVIEFLTGENGIPSVVSKLGELGGAAGNASGKDALGGLADAADDVAGSLGGGAAGGAASGGASSGGLAGAAEGAGGVLAAVFAPTALATGVFTGTALLTNHILESTGSIKRFQKTVEDGTWDKRLNEQFTHVSSGAEESHRKVSDAYNGAKADIDASTSAAAKSLEDTANTMAETTKKNAESSGNWADAIGGFFSKMRETSTTSTGEIKAKVSTDLNEIKTNVEVNTASMSTSWGKNLSEMKESTETNASEVKVQTSGMLTEIKSNFDNSGDILEDSGNKVVEGFGNGAEYGGAWDNVKNFFSGVLDWIVNNKGPIEEDYQALIPAGEAIMRGFKDGSNSGWDKVKGFFGGVKDTVTGFFNGSGEWLAGNGAGIIDGLGRGATSAWEGVNTFLNERHGVITDKFNGAGEWLNQKGRDIISGLKAGNDAIWPRVSEFFESVKGKIGDRFSNSSNWLADAGNNIIKGLKRGIDSSWNLVSRFMDSVHGKVTGVFKNAYDWLKGSGTSIINGLNQGLQNSSDSVANKLWSIASNAVNSFKRFFGIASPSKLMAQLGNYTMEGWANGIEGNARKAERAMLIAAQSVYDATSGFPELNFGETVPALSSSSNNSGNPPINIYMTYNAGEDAKEIVYDMVGQLRRYGYTMGV